MHGSDLNLILITAATYGFIFQNNNLLFEAILGSMLDLA